MTERDLMIAHRKMIVRNVLVIGLRLLVLGLPWLIVGLLDVLARGLHTASEWSYDKFATMTAWLPVTKASEIDKRRYWEKRRRDADDVWEHS